MGELLGWDLMYKVSENDIKKKEDVLALLVHFCLIKKGFRCSGLGESKVVAAGETTSEVLPVGWSSSTNYLLRYTRDNVAYILRAIPVDGNLIFNLMNMGTLSVSNVAFHVASTVSGLRGPILSLVPEAETVMSQITSNLLDPLEQAAATTSTTTQTTPTAGESRNAQSGPTRPLIVDPPLSGPRPGFPSLLVDPRPEYGRSDLDPFAGPRGGGMIFPGPGGLGIPQSPDPGIGIPQGLPPGAIPPGARFDPYGPSSADPRRPPPHPDPDDID